VAEWFKAPVLKTPLGRISRFVLVWLGAVSLVFSTVAVLVDAGMGLLVLSGPVAIPVAI
jgi:hypothetical protein